MKKFNNFGFTLLELMITVAIVGALASMAVPSFQKLIERNRLKEAAESLKSDMQTARTEAIKLSQDIIVTRNTGNDGAWCYGYNTGSACDCSQTTTTAADYCDLKNVSGNYFSQTNLLSVSANTTFRFRRGTANASNVCFSTTHYKIKVKVSRTGRTTLCTHSDATAVPGIEACTTDNC